MAATSASASTPTAILSALINSPFPSRIHLAKSLGHRKRWRVKAA
jgi:hypothetical protein